MKRLSFLLIIGIFFIACGSESEKIERIKEDGVEVIINHIEPYEIEGEASILQLKEVLSIDLERDDILRSGMGIAGEFNVDSQGNIFVVAFSNDLHFIYKFNSEGKFIKSFAQNGQGPGDLKWPVNPVITENDELFISDGMKKAVIYDNDGGFIKEIKFSGYYMQASPLNNQNFLAYGINTQKKTIDGNNIEWSLFLLDSNFKLIKTIDSQIHADGNKMVPFFMWRISNNHIFTVNENRGYEIWIFDFNGNMVKKIKKEYKPQYVTEKIKKLIIGPNYGKDGLSHDKYFPRPLPPINQFFTDDESRLFVMTYEEGENPDEYIWDIFNKDGVFIGRKSLNLNWATMYLGPRYTTAKNNKLYLTRTKESGYHILKVYDMKWE